MRIVCPTCDTAYEIRPEALGAQGRTVRCAACASTWFATPVPEPMVPPRDEPDILPPDAPSDPARESPDAAVTAERAEPTLPDMTPSEAPAGARLVRDVESRGRRRKPGKRPSGKGAPSGSRGPLNGPMILGVTVLAVMAAIYFRDAVVRVLPDTAGLFAAIGLPVNLRGLEFRDVATSIEFEAGQPVTIVEGRIQNITDASLAVPRLRLAVRGTDGREVMSWAASATRPVVGPRESVSFRTRLTSPVRDGSDVEVRFLAQRDVRTGAVP